MHKSRARARRKKRSRIIVLQTAYFCSFFGKFRAAIKRLLHFAFALARTERSETIEKKLQINLFKNSDQIRICRRFIVYYCYYDSVASIREIDFDGFFVYFSSFSFSLRCPCLSFGTRNFYQAQIKRTRIIMCIVPVRLPFLRVSLFRELFYYEFIDVWHFRSFRCACDSLSPHAFDYY